MAGIETAVEAARRYIIKRPRLTRLLDSANARILMLIAPAGFGKTTLAREWVAERPHVWYRGTTATADVAALAAQLSDVVSEVVPDAGSRMVHRMRATGTPEQDVDILADLFAEDLVDWPEDTWLVFDDYQFAMEARAPERFADVLLRKSPVRLLLTSRKRPSWASARRLLYGEIYEVGRNELAMDHEEAAAVLAHRKDAPAAGLVALAEGWPAVIGLAALTEEFELPEGNLPDALYEYFAEELFQAASPEVQRGLCRLALAPSLRQGVAEFLLGNEAPLVIAEGVRLGFLSASRSESLEMHPLLRPFLTSRYVEAEDPKHGTTELAHWLIERENWDDALSVTERFFTADLLLDLLGSFITAGLRQARLSTLSQCVAIANAKKIDSPLIDLAEAEIAFRKGLWSQAEELAAFAAQRMGDTNPLTSRAFYVAGLSAHLMDDDERALEYQSRARATARSVTDTVDALSAQLNSAVCKEADDAEELLVELNKTVPDRPEARLRAIQGEVFLTLLTGEVERGLRRAELGNHLLPRVSEPLVRTSFLNGWSYELVLAARYREAQGVALRFIRDATAFRLKFALPHAYLNAAAAELGMGRFSRCSHFIEQAEASTGAQDTFSALNAPVLRTKLLLALGASAEAVQATTHRPLRSSAPSIEGEFLAIRSLALACGGDYCDALPLLTQAAELTRRTEVASLIPLVRAIIDLQREDANAEATVHRALDVAVRTGTLDAVVTAYRAYPPLLHIWASETRNHPLLSSLMNESNDRAHALSIGVALARRPLAESGLSRRELEVIGLVSEGLTNSEIAKKLFISVATVKVHLNHIYDKLGVRTRTEAALRAATGFTGEMEEI